jgi:hypothetical protein
MADEANSKGWWHTLPGILTGIAAVLTAVTGIAAIVIQTTKNPGTTPASPPEPLPVAETSGPGGAANRVADMPVAVITASDGAVTRVSANTVRYCISVGTSLRVSGQEVPFDRIRSFEVMRSDVYLAPGAMAQLRIAMISGDTLTGNIDANCDVFGYNDIGRYSITFDKLSRVVFER